MISAALLGGCSGWSLKRIMSKSIGIDTIIAYISSNLLTSYTVLVFSLMKKPGAAAPMLAERMVKDTAKKVIRLAEPIGNQLVANLLGVLMMKIFPKAHSALPIRTKVELPS
jgi:lambda repressor-like predicted transcriptional regulator